MGSITLADLILVIAVAAIGATLIFLRSRPSKANKKQVRHAASPNTRSVSPRAGYVTDEHGAASHLTKGELQPDSVLRCTIQTGDGTNADFLDGLVGSYCRDKFLRILMQNDEDDDPRGYWHSWDVPWSQLVQIIRRERITPPIHSNVRQPDGTYHRNGAYLQTRLYKVGRGMECRLLDRDESDMDQRGEPYQWLRANVLDRDVRFSEDTQDNPLYGDTTGTMDRLDEYALRIKSRSDADADRTFSSGALSVSKEKFAALVAASPEDVRKYLKSAEYQAEFERRFAKVRLLDGSQVSNEYRAYARRVLELLLVGAIKGRFYGMFFYENFPADSLSRDIDESARCALLNQVRLMFMRFNPSLT